MHSCLENWRVVCFSVSDNLFQLEVLAVVRKQMDVCFIDKPETIEKLEELLASHSYHHMQKIWEKEWSAKEAEELQSDAVKYIYLK